MDLYQISSIVFTVASSLHDLIEQLTTRHELKHKEQLTWCLKYINQLNDAVMAQLLHNIDLASE